MQEIEPEGSNNGSAEDHELEGQSGATDLKPLGDLQKGSIDIVGAVVDIRDNPDRPFGMIGLEWIIRIETPDSRTPFEVAAASQSEALVRVHHILSRILNFLFLIVCFERKKIVFSVKNNS